jgi:hypothetical protein
MLLEVPNMAMNAHDNKRKIISRSFRKLLDLAYRQVFSGPPESTRDFVVVASKALSHGDWKKSADLLVNLPVWNLANNPEGVRTLLRRKLQEEALRTYLFTHAPYYDSLTLKVLTDMFELPTNTVHALVSRMINLEELHASWDQPSLSIIMHKVEPSRLQAFSLQLAEKVAGLAEHNEKMMDLRTGGYGYGHKHDSTKPQTKDRWQERPGYNRPQRHRYGQDSSTTQQRQGFQNKPRHTRAF